MHTLGGVCSLNLCRIQSLVRGFGAERPDLAGLSAEGDRAEELLRFALHSSDARLDCGIVLT